MKGNRDRVLLMVALLITLIIAVIQNMTNDPEDIKGSLNGLFELSSIFIIILPFVLFLYFILPALIILKLFAKRRYAFLTISCIWIIVFSVNAVFISQEAWGRRTKFDRVSNS
ncbi:MAG: hypothetical protein ACRCWQ_08670, partial [Bacilli bacterium]